MVEDQLDTSQQSSITHSVKVHSRRRNRQVFFVGLLALAVFTAIMRFYKLDSISFGLHLDESYNGLDAYSLIGQPPWHWPVFFTSNFGREPLHIWLTTLIQFVFGPTKLALRFVPSVISFLLTPALVWFGWEIAPYLNVRRRAFFAFLTGASVLTMLWAQMHARILVRGGLFLLLEVLIFASFWRAWSSKKSIKWWVLTGLFIGISLYTYLPARLLPLVFLLAIPISLKDDLVHLKRERVGIAIAILVAILIFVPLGHYFLDHPDDFFLRTGQVNVFTSGDFSPIEQVLKVLGMAFIRGDSNLRMNYPLRPVLDIFMVVPFLVGMWLLLRNPLRLGQFFVLDFAIIMLTPTLFSLDPPNFGRAIGALPFFSISIALSLEKVLSWSIKRKKHFQIVITMMVLGLLFASGLLTSYVYFVKLQAIPDRFYMWDEGPTRLAYHVRESDPAHRVYIGPGAQGLDHPTVRYILLGQPAGRIHSFDGRTCLRIATDTPAFYYFINNDFVRGPNLLQSYLPDSTITDVVVDHTGVVWAKRIDQPRNGEIRLPEMRRYPVTLDDGVEMLGYWLSPTELQPESHLYVRLFWRASDTPQKQYTGFVHLLQSDGLGGFVMIAGSDGEPGQGACSTDDWLPNEIIVDEKELILPADFASTEDDTYYIETGFYTLEDGQRLNVPGDSNNRILIGPLNASDLTP